MKKGAQIRAAGLLLRDAGAGVAHHDLDRLPVAPRLDRLRLVAGLVPELGFQITLAPR